MARKKIKEYLDASPPEPKRRPGKPQVYPRRGDYYVIAESHIIEIIADSLPDNIDGKDARAILDEYNKLLQEKAHELSLESGIQVSVDDTREGLFWLIPATQFNGTRYVWMSRKAQKMIKLLIKLLIDKAQQITGGK